MENEPKSLTISGQDYPHDTVFCNSAIKIENNGGYSKLRDTPTKKKFIHLMIPSYEEEEENDSLIRPKPESYIGVYAEVIDSRRVFVNGGE